MSIFEKFNAWITRGAPQKVVEMDKLTYMQTTTGKPFGSQLSPANQTGRAGADLPSERVNGNTRRGVSDVRSIN